MYAGGILYMIGMSARIMARSSRFAADVLGALSVRIFIEEDALRKGLPGLRRLCCAGALQANPRRVVM